MSPDQQMLNSAPVLLRLRIIWAALVLGVVTFGAFVGLLVAAGGLPGAGHHAAPADMLTLIAVAMLVMMIPAGLFARNQFYKKNWRANVVTPSGYFTGNLLLLAMLEGVAMFSIVATLIIGAFGWAILPGVIALALLLVNFPTGRPMQPAENPYESPPPR